MNIGEAAKKSGLSVKTVRFYSDIGLISPDKSTESNYRIYSNQDVEKLLFVGKARKFDFSIEECRELLSLYENKERPSSEVKKITLKKIEEIEFHDVFQDMPSSQLIMPKKEVKEIQQIQRQHSGLPLLSKLLL